MPVPIVGISPSKTINTIGTKVGNILSRKDMYCYSVPRHQRAYSWENKSPNYPINKFLEDIDAAVSSGWVHNFGSLDMKNKGKIQDVNTGKDADIDNGSGMPITGLQLEVNDGQQRIITFFLTFAAITAIRRLNGDTTYEKSLHSDSATCYEITTTSKSNVAYRINLQEEELTEHLAGIMFDLDDAVYKVAPKGAILTANEKEKSNMKISLRRPMNLMNDAYRQIRQHLGEMDSKTLDKWEKVFYNSEIVTTYTSTPSHVVFEARNARGMVVSELDKVKNKTMHYQKTFTDKKLSFKEDIVASWWAATKNMEDGEVYNENSLLGYALTIVNGKTVGKGDYNDFLKDYKMNELVMKKKGKSVRNNLEHFIDTIKWISEAMKEVYQPHPTNKPMVFGNLDKMTKRGMNKIQRTKAIVNLVNITNRMDRDEIFKPVVLLAYHFVKPSEFVKLLDLLEKIIFRVYLVNKARTDNGSRRFGELCNDFFTSVKDKSGDQAGDKAEITKHFTVLYSKLCEWAKSDEDGISNEELYAKIKESSNAYKSRWTRYFLYHWEMSGPGSINPNIRMAKSCNKWAKPESNKTYFTIEHIMPQTGWKKYPEKEISALVFPTGHEKDGYKMRHYWLDKFGSDNDYNKHVNYLGNLVLSMQKYNSIYDNFPFKRNPVEGKNYMKSKSVMYNTLPGIFDWTKVGVVSNRYTDWNIETIEHRQERMARWARIYWKLPCEEAHLLEPQKEIKEYMGEQYLKSSQKDLRENQIKQIDEIKQMDDKKINSAVKTDNSEYLLDLSEDYDIDYKDEIDYVSELKKGEKPSGKKSD